MNLINRLFCSWVLLLAFTINSLVPTSLAEELSEQGDEINAGQDLQSPASQVENESENEEGVPADPIEVNPVSDVSEEKSELVEVEAVLSDDPISVEESISLDNELLEDLIPTTNDVVETVITEASSSEESATVDLNYGQLMQQFRSSDIYLEKRNQQDQAKQGWLKKLFSSDEPAEIPALADQELGEVIGKFIEKEKGRLEELNIDQKKVEKYLKRLQKQQDVLSREDELKEPGVEIKIPENPSTFDFGKQEVELKSLKNKQRQNFKDVILNKLSWFIPSSVVAYTDETLPTLADVAEDAGQIHLTNEVTQLANSLGNNPVKILNFVKNEITYEPYFGAKKGALGCLEQQVCNDTDTTSLAISLLRAAGIPARYKTATVVFAVEELQDLLGIQDTKSVYFALASAGVPVYTVSGNNLGDFETADFSAETELALDWTWVQAFVDYDLNQGNASNYASFAAATTDVEVREILQDYPQNFWLNLDPTFGKNELTAATPAHDTANFDTETFWKDFLSYTGDLSPLEKYRADLQVSTGVDIFDSTQISSIAETVENFSILPLTPAFYLADPALYTIFSELPTTSEHTMRIALTDENDNEVFAQEFASYEVDNLPIELTYEAATEADLALIESYGGIHATPTELVDLRPVLTTPQARFVGTTDLAIGQSLVLGFEHKLGNTVLNTSEKYSIAGNSEGVYLAFSRINSDSAYDDTVDLKQNSKILLAGNAQIARQYLLQLQQDADLLTDSLQMAYQNDLTRAVVTQNRVLTEVAGSPTTFDFSGLTLDAHSALQSASRVGDYGTHRSDFHFLFGLQASYTEASELEQITGLDSIATVQGLQAASADSANYTVHEIDATNESVIDTLTLSDNTKVDLHAAISAGETVITPDKPVTVGSFTGVLYITYSPDGFARYAIGEQVVQNGGFVTEIFDAGYYEDENNFISEDGVWVVMKTENGDVIDHFSYTDAASPDKKNFSCREDFTWITSILETKDDLGLPLEQRWNPDYGLPCYRPETDTYEHSDFVHTYILATDGAKFYSSSSERSYNYWAKADDIKTILQNAGTDAGITLEDEMKFDPHSRTYYLRDDHFWTPHEEAIYYAPDSDGVGDGFVVSGVTYDRVIVENELRSKLGYPVGNEQDANSHFSGQHATKQKFAAGNMYEIDNTILDESYYLSGVIVDYFENQQGGAGGDIGLPIQDSIYAGLNQEYLGVFESGSIQFLEGLQQFNILENDEHVRRRQTKKFAEERVADVSNGLITDVEAFAQIADYVAHVTPDHDTFVKDLTVVLMGTDTVAKSQLEQKLYEHTNYWYKQKFQKFPSLAISKDETFSDRGFKFEYNDSHYAVEQRQEQHKSNQIFHAMAGFALGYFHAITFSEISNMFHERKSNALGFRGRSKEDLDLTTVMIQIGSALSDSSLSKEDIGTRLLADLADPGYLSMRMSDEVYKELAEHRKKFRIFEYSQNGNTDDRWSYDQDVSSYTCSETTHYYQPYQYIYIEDQKHEYPWLIWDDASNSMILSSAHSSQDQFCLSVDVLTQKPSFDLPFRFNDMYDCLEEQTLFTNCSSQ